MKLKINHLVFAALLSAAVLSCSNEPYDEPVTKPDEKIDLSTEITNLKTPQSLKVDITTLSNLIKSKSTKAQSRATGLSVELIKSNDEQGGIFVINFGNDNGFMLCSATKSFYPVIAYSDNGHFDTENCPENVSLWKENALDIISESCNWPEDSLIKFKSIWSEFEENGILETISRSPHPSEYPSDWDETVIQAYEDSRRIMMDSIVYWTSQGYTVLSPASITEEAYNQWGENNLIPAIEACQGPIYYRFEERWQDVSAIVIKPTPSTQITINNFLTTEWGNYTTFQMSFPFVNGERMPVPCGIVALGQIMKYYMWPSNYDWSSMPNNTGNKIISDFLLNIYNVALNVNHPINPTNNIIRTDGLTEVLTEFGYSSQVNNHIEILPYMENREPVLVTGFPSQYENGHAFLACGYSFYDGATDIYSYVFYQPDNLL